MTMTIMCFLPWASLGSQHFGTRGGDATLERHRKHGDSLVQRLVFQAGPWAARIEVKGIWRTP